MDSRHQSEKLPVSHSPRASFPEVDAFLARPSIFHLAVPRLMPAAIYRHQYDLPSFVMTKMSPHIV
jgi:hypothetical protein